MLAVIGDVHGCYNTLKKLLATIQNNWGGVPVYTTGDLIDRGKYPHLVLEFVMGEGIQSVLGNHECMFYHYCRFENSYLGEMWNSNNYHTTKDAYNITPELIEGHLDFISRLPFFYNTEDCFISHAGVAQIHKQRLFFDSRIDEERLDNYFSQTMESDTNILWNRDDLLNLGKLQVVGHTRRREVEHDGNCNALYLDTSAFSGARLSAAIVDSGRVIEIISAETDKRDI